MFIHSLHAFQSVNQVHACFAADILWQPSSLPCLGISSTMRKPCRSAAWAPRHKPPIAFDSYLSFQSHPYLQTALFGSTLFGSLSSGNLLIVSHRRLRWLGHLARF